MISPKIYFILYLVSQIVVDVNLNKITVLEYIQLVTSSVYRRRSIKCTRFHDF